MNFEFRQAIEDSHLNEAEAAWKAQSVKKNQKIKKKNENITTATSIWVKQFFNPVILFQKII